LDVGQNVAPWKMHFWGKALGAEQKSILLSESFNPHRRNVRKSSSHTCSTRWAQSRHRSWHCVNLSLLKFTMIPALLLGA